MTLLISLILTANAPIDLTLTDPLRHRDIALHVALPTTKSAAPLILFTGPRHPLTDHLARHGFVTIALHHPGPDDATLETFRLRLQDVTKVLDALTTWNEEKKHPLHHRIDLNRIALIGNQSGNAITQALSGQHFQSGRTFTDARIKATVLLDFSPASTADFSTVTSPWLLISTTPHLDRLPSGQKYELVTATPNPRATNAATTAFLEAVLTDSADAKALLLTGPKPFLTHGDTWSTK